MPVFPRIYRSYIFPRLLILPKFMVHAERAGIAYCSVIFRFAHLRCIWRPGDCRDHEPHGLHQGSTCVEVRGNCLCLLDVSADLIRWVFIIEGAITVVIACSAFFILPNFPRTTSWLTEEERQLAAYRLIEDVGEDDWTDSASQSFFHGLKLALADIKTWVLMILLLSIVSSVSLLKIIITSNSTDRLKASVTNFFPTVVKTLGYGNVQTLLLTAPPYVLAVITTYLNAWHADRTGERFLHIVIPLCVGVVAFILCAATHSTAPRYVAMMLMVPGVYTGYVVALTWISNSLPRPAAKRAAALAFINAISNTSSIYASYMYPQPKKGQPNLTVPLSVDCATAVLAIIMATIMRVILARLNKKLNKGEHVEGAINAVPGQGQENGFRFLL
jgi:hypothetical protein